MLTTKERAIPTEVQASICFDCDNAVFGCCWSNSFDPVPGWTAEPSKLYKESGCYHVIACPEFVPSENRISKGILGEKENEEFLADCDAFFAKRHYA